MAGSAIFDQLISTNKQDIYPGATTLNRRRIYILPTRQGITFSVLLFTMLLGAINYNNSLAYMLTFLLGSLFIIGILHTYRNLAGLAISGSRPESVFAGEMAYFPIMLDNREGQARPAVRLICYPKQKYSRLKSYKNYQSVFIDIQPDIIQRVYVPLRTQQRGLLPLGRIMVSSCFPLGLFRAWSYVDIDHNCVVYPRPDGLYVIPSHQQENMLGLHGSQAGTDDFAGFRPYHPGDSIRSIDWKAYAREQGLLVKRFSGSEVKKQIISWDDVLHLDTTEERLSQMCRWIIEAEKQGTHYSLILPDKHIGTGLGDIHKRQCLEALAIFRIDKDG